MVLLAHQGSKVLVVSLVRPESQVHLARLASMALRVVVVLKACKENKASVATQASLASLANMERLVNEVCEGVQVFLGHVALVEQKGQMELAFQDLQVGLDPVGSQECKEKLAPEVVLVAMARLDPVVRKARMARMAKVARTVRLVPKVLLVFLARKVQRETVASQSCKCISMPSKAMWI